jgi:signal-transduction protein with cAMP-binding, CBS, and nucleotidyltransferase domain
MATCTPPRAGEDPVRRLRDFALFSGLPVDELDQLAASCDVCTAHPGQVIQAQDVPVRLWHLLVRGHVIVQRDGTPIGLLSQGDSWSEHSLLNRQRSPIAVVALSPVTLLTLREREFFAIPEQHPVLAGRLVARAATSPDRLAVPVFNALTHVGGVR